MFKIDDLLSMLIKIIGGVIIVEYFECRTRYNTTKIKLRTILKSLGDVFQRY